MPLFLSDDSENLKKRAEKLSLKLGHFYLGCEHFFLATLDNKQWLQDLLKDEDVDLEQLREHILNICGPGDEEPLWKGIITTPRLKRILKLAEKEAESKLSHRVQPEHIISAICREGRSIPARVLESLQVDVNHLRQEILDLEISKKREEPQPRGQYFPVAGTPYSAFIARKGKSVPPADAEGKIGPEVGKKKKKKKKTKTPTLDKLGRDLVHMAREGKIEPIVGRKDEIRRVLQTLTKKMKNNPIIIGEAGVGKTAVVYGLAHRIANGKIPEIIRNKRIIEMGMSTIVAGTKHRGEFEERMQKIIDELKANPDIIIFIDEIHTIMGAGDSRGGLHAGNILKPYLARNEITVIGATTIDEYRKHIEKDPALERRFQPVMVDEPSEEDTVKILNGLKERYEKHHGVTFTDKAIQAAVKLSERYIPDRNLPDKAIDLMDEAAARSQLSFTSICEDEEEKIEDLSNQVTEEDIAEVVSLWTGVPVAKLTQEESERLLHMEDWLRKRVVGQENAVKTVAQTIRMVRMGLSSPHRPSGVFLFLGPTGVGKTELAKSLAEFLFESESDMVRLDMSEYMEKHAISRMIGSPPGYVGHEEEGQLTKQVRTKPYCVVLLDEVEKAHPDVFDLFLQVFDDGRLTDSKGRTINFTNTIIIMTSNIGTSSVDFSGKTRVVDSSDPVVQEEIMEELRQHFRPEFLNRIDEIIIFNPLNEAALKKIVRMNIDTLADHLKKQRDINLRVDESAMEFLLKQGYDPEYGARPMKRAIQNYLAKPLAEAMLSHGVESDDTVLVKFDGEKLVFETGGEVAGSMEGTLSPDGEPGPEPPGDDGQSGTGKPLPKAPPIRDKEGQPQNGTIPGEPEEPKRLSAEQSPKGGVEMKKPRKIPKDHPLKKPPSKRKPILKQRGKFQQIAGIMPMKGPMVGKTGEPPEDLDPEDFEDTRPGKGPRK